MGNRLMKGPCKAEQENDRAGEVCATQTLIQLLTSCLWNTVLELDELFVVRSDSVLYHCRARSEVRGVWRPKTGAMIGVWKGKQATKQATNMPRQTSSKRQQFVRLTDTNA